MPFVFILNLETFKGRAVANFGTAALAVPKFATAAPKFGTALSHV